jgi:hypothetical protein
MHLGPGRTATFIRQVLDAGSYVVCHDTLTYGDFPDYGPAICRGFFDVYRNRSRALLILARRTPPDRGSAAAHRPSGGTRPRCREDPRHRGLRR